MADEVEGEVHESHEAQPRRRQQRPQVHATVACSSGSLERLPEFGPTERKRTQPATREQAAEESALSKEGN